MNYIFISYSSKNMQAALDVKSVLEQNGVSCWMAPECIAPGSNYTEAIPEAIEGCFAFVLVLSGEAQCSQWVTKELDMALNKNKPIVPFHVDTAALTGQYDFMLAGCQRIEAYSRVSAAYEELLGLLKRLNPDAVVMGQQAQKLEATISDTFEANVAAQVSSSLASESGASLAQAGMGAGSNPSATDQAPRKSKKWIPIVIAAASVICIAVIIGVIVTVVNVTKTVKQAAQDSFGKYGNEFGDLVTGLNDGSVSVSVSPEGEVNVSANDHPSREDNNTSDGMSFGDALDGASDSTSDNTSGSSLGDSLGDVFGGASSGSTDDILGNLDGLGIDLGALLGMSGSQTTSGLSSSDAATMEMFGYKSMYKLDYDIDGTATLDGETYNNAGTSYPSAMRMSATSNSGTRVEFDLDRKHSVATGEISVPQGFSGDGLWGVDIYVDGEKLETISLSASASPKAFMLDISGKNKIVFEIKTDSAASGEALLGGAYVY